MTFSAGLGCEICADEPSAKRSNAQQHVGSRCLLDVRGRSQVDETDHASLQLLAELEQVARCNKKVEQVGHRVPREIAVSQRAHSGEHCVDEAARTSWAHEGRRTTQGRSESLERAQAHEFRVHAKRSHTQRGGIVR